ncbi:MAG: protease modulator HflC [Candidatus Omnitrophota bacterium]
MNKIHKLLKLTSMLIALVLLGVLTGTLYTVDETQQVIITQFGEPIGEPIKNAGLQIKIPFIQVANYFDKRVLAWDGDPNQIPTKDKRYIFVDTTARWRIVDPLKFMQSVGNEIGAQARLDDIIDAATRDFVTSHELVETVRNSNRLLEKREEEASEEEGDLFASEAIERIQVGRDALTRGILKQASGIMPQYGIELLDVRIKRINYVEDVRQKVYDRMISERKRAAEQYRSEGQGKKAEIEGQMSKELQEIQSIAKKKALMIMGEADAKATTVYADAYNKDPEFYSFLRTLEAYRDSINPSTTMVLTTDSEYYHFLKSNQE